MTLRHALAAVLDGWAARLRGPTTENATTASPPPPQSPPALPSARAMRHHPRGFWLCTHSTFTDFVVGFAYPAYERHSGVRIYPYEGSSWAPYWQPDEGRFCYPAKDLDFVYLGSKLPAGQAVDTRTLPQRIAA